MTGHIYFIEAVGATAIKIGWAKSPKRRLIQHAISCPLELRLLATAPGTLGHEGALQTRFAIHCIRGEWYRENPDLSALICEVSESGELPSWVVPAVKISVQDRPGIVPLERCIEITGSQGAVARVLGVTPAAISNALLQNKKVPPHWCLKLEAETLKLGRPVWRDELRPDLYPASDLQYLHAARRHDLRPDLYPQEGNA